MQLPEHPEGGVMIGISDILAWRDCPARFEFGMQRHGELGESPESWSPANAYGSMIHHCIHLVNRGVDEEDAIQAAFETWPQWVEPNTLDLLRADLAIYLGRDPIGVTTIVSEEDWSVPLFVHPEVGQVWFRFRLDRLYQVTAQPWRFIGVDYKSSKWPKSEAEVSSDLQNWAYNVGIMLKLVDLYPEFDEIELLQLYDQLKYGQVPTRKNPAQRATMHEWLVRAVTAMIADEKMAPRFNQWCPWCFPAGTAVVAEGGVVRVIEEIKPGDLVLTARGRYRPVTGVASRRKARLQELTLSGGACIATTSEHPILATRASETRTIDKLRLSGDLRRESPPPGFFRLRGAGRGVWIAESSVTRTWVEAGKLAAGDLVWGRLAPDRPQPLSEDELRILGWFLAEGDAGQRSVSFSLHRDEVEYQAEIEHLLRTVFGATHFDVQRRGRTWQAYLHDHHAAAWFRFFGGKGASQKRIHPLAFAPGSLLPLVVAAWKGDGTKPKPTTTQLAYTTSSRTLAYQIQTVLLTFGFRARMSVRKAHQYARSATEMGFRQDAYSLGLSGADAARFAPLLGGTLRAGSFTQAPSLALLGPWVGQAILSVGEGSSAAVHNLAVAGDESFVLADQVAVHNCSIAMDCPVVQYQLTDWARARIAALMPREPKKKKDGTDSKVIAPPVLDPGRFAEYAQLLPDVKRARQVLELFEETVKDVIVDLPIDQQAALVNSEAPKGYTVDHRSRKEFTAEGLRLAHEAMGGEFYYAATMSEASLKRLYGGDAKERLEEILRHRVDGAGFDVVVPAK